MKVKKRKEKKMKMKRSDSGKGEGQGRGKGGRGRKVWQRGVIAERIERVQLHLMVGEKGVIAMRENERDIERER